LTTSVSRETLVEMYRKMFEIRSFEEKVFELYAQNLVPARARQSASVKVTQCYLSIRCEAKAKNGRKRCIKNYMSGKEICLG